MRLDLDRSSWKRVKLGDVVLRSRTQADPIDVGVDRYIGGGHVDTESVIIQRSGDVADGQMGPTFRYVFKPGQVLFVSARPYLRKSGVPDFAGVVADKTYVLEAAPDNGLLNYFLPFLLKSDRFVDYANQEATGSMNPRLLWGAMQRYEFDLPPFEEQKRIADLLWALERHRLALAVYRSSLKKSASELRKSSLTGKNWGGRLGEALTSITAGRSFAASPSPVKGGSFGVLKVSAVGGDGFAGSENKELLDQKDFLPQFALSKGDFLITRANTLDYVGRPAIVDADYPNLMLSDKTLRLEVDFSVTSPEFLRECLMAPQARAAIAGAATGTSAAMKNISQADIRSLPIPLLPLDEQNAFLRKMKIVDNSLNCVDRERSMLISLKASIFFEIFGGDL